MGLVANEILKREGLWESGVGFAIYEIAENGIEREAFGLFARSIVGKRDNREHRGRGFRGYHISGNPCG